MRKNSPGHLIPFLCNVIGIAMLLAVIVMVVPLAVPRLMGYECYRVETGSMEPEIPVGSVVYVHSTLPQEVRTGEVIAFFKDETVITHRVRENRIVEGEFITKGDANPIDDVEAVKYAALVGRVEYHLPILGEVLNVIATDLGKVYLLVIAACGVMLNILASRMRYNRLRRQQIAKQVAARKVQRVKTTRTAEREAFSDFAKSDPEDHLIREYLAKRYGVPELLGEVPEDANAPADAQAEAADAAQAEGQAGAAAGKAAVQLFPKRRHPVRNTIMIALLVVFFGAAVGAVMVLWQYHTSDVLYSKTAMQYVQDVSRTSINPASHIPEYLLGSYSRKANASADGNVGADGAGNGNQGDATEGGDAGVDGTGNGNQSEGIVDGNARADGSVNGNQGEGTTDDNTGVDGIGNVNQGEGTADGNAGADDIGNGNQGEGTANGNAGADGTGNGNQGEDIADGNVGADGTGNGNQSEDTADGNAEADGAGNGNQGEGTADGNVGADGTGNGNQGEGTADGNAGVDDTGNGNQGEGTVDGDVGADGSVNGQYSGTGTITGINKDGTQLDANQDNDNVNSGDGTSIYYTDDNDGTGVNQNDGTVNSADNPGSDYSVDAGQNNSTVNSADNPGSDYFVDDGQNSGTVNAGDGAAGQNTADGMANDFSQNDDNLNTGDADYYTVSSDGVGQNEHLQYDVNGRIVKQEASAEEKAQFVEDLDPKLVWEEQKYLRDHRILAPIKVDFKSLKEVNDDVRGWIYCQDTIINYPVLHGETDDTYLRHTYDGEYNIAGSIFIEALNDPDFNDYNTIIYGHHMSDGSMFAGIDYWGEQSYYDEHPVMWLLTPKRDYLVVLFSGYTTSAYSETYLIFDEPSEEFTEYIKNVLEKSDFETDFVLPEDGHYVLLTTCAYVFDNARHVLHGLLIPADSAGGTPIW